MSRGLEHLLSDLATRREQHDRLIRGWFESGDMSDMAYYRFHSDKQDRLERQIETVLNLLERG